MLSISEVTDIFHLCDELSTEFEICFPRHTLRENNGKPYRNKPNRLSESEVMTLLIAFLLSGMRYLKAYYLFYVCRLLTNEFPKLVSYNRFFELQQRFLLTSVLFF